MQTSNVKIKVIDPNTLGIKDIEGNIETEKVEKQNNNSSLHIIYNKYYFKEGNRMKYDKIETGVNLRQLRIENKLSPGEVSDIVDKSESHIMQLERGSRNLTVEMLCKFADVYNTDPNTILGISSQRMVVMIDKLKSLPTDTSEQLIGTFISVIDNLGVLAGGGK